MPDYSQREIDIACDKYQGKLDIQTRNDNTPCFIDYFEECEIESTVRFSRLHLNDLDQAYYQIELDIRAVISIMLEEFTLLGCKELLTLCILAIKIMKQNGNYDAAKGRFYTLIMMLFELANESRLHSINPYFDGDNGENIFSITNQKNLLNHANVIHFFNQFDFLFNLLQFENIVLTRALTMKILNEVINEKGKLEDLIRQYSTLFSLDEITDFEYNNYQNLMNQYIDYYRRIVQMSNTGKENLEDGKRVDIQTNNTTDSGFCYIATAVYGSYDAEEVLVLRRFRDEVLSKSLLGRLFIRAYYTVSPPIARFLRNDRYINNTVRKVLNIFVKKYS